MKIVLITLLFLVPSSIWSPLSAQDTIDYEIRLIKLKTGKTHHLDEGRKIRFRLKDFEGRHKGRITGIRPDSIRIDQVWIDTDRISSIRIKMRGTVITGGALSGLGLIVGAGGTLILLSGLEQGGGAALVGIIIGAPLAGAGALGVMAGVPLIFMGRKFDLKRKWTLDIVKEE